MKETTKVTNVVNLAKETGRRWAQDAAGVVNLGDRVKDSVSGFIGVVICRMEWLHGCTRYTVQPPIGKDGKIPDNVTFDEAQLIVLKRRAVRSTNFRTGGPIPGPRQKSGPTR